MTQIRKRNGTKLVKSNTISHTNNTLLGSNTSRSVDSIGNQNFSSSAPVTADNNRRKSVDSTLSTSSYNGSNPDLLRERADSLQMNVEDYETNNHNMLLAKEVASKLDRGEPLTAEEEQLWEHVKTNNMDNFDATLGFVANLEREIQENNVSIAGLQNRVSEKQAKADLIESQQVNGSTNNQTPTQFVHEVESTSPMEIIPDDD